MGAVPMMSNGSTLPRNDANVNNGPENMVHCLNTYIYDYFLKRGYNDCARALVQDESIKLNTEPVTKTSPSQRRDVEMNGVDADTDAKDPDKMKLPDDLPRPNLPSESMQSSFLLDWFSLFWDVFWAQHKKGNSNDVRQYVQHTQVYTYIILSGFSSWTILVLLTRAFAFYIEFNAPKRTTTESIIPPPAYDACAYGSDACAP